MPKSNDFSRSRSHGRSYTKHKRARRSSSSEPSYYKKPIKNYEGGRYFLSPMPESDIKNHIRFENLKIRKKVNQEETIKDLEKEMADSIGPIQHITKVSQNDLTITLAIGFKYDIDALDFLDGKYGDFETGYDKEKIKFIPVPTETFKRMIPTIIQIRKEREREIMRIEKMEYERQRKARQEKREYEKYSRKSPSDKDKKRRKYSSSSQSRRYKREKHQKKRKYDSSQESDRSRRHKEHSAIRGMAMRDTGEKRVLCFGLPTHFKGKQVTQYLQHHPVGPIYASRWQWKKIPGSNCEYMKIEMDEKMVTKLMSILEDMEIDGHLFLITNPEHEDQDKIRSSLKQYQMKVTFPSKVHPFHVYKAISEYSKVMQIVAVNRLADNGTCDCYNITLSNVLKVNQFKKIVKASSSIIVEEPTQGMLVYRPSRDTRFLSEEKPEA